MNRSIVLSVGLLALAGCASVYEGDAAATAFVNVNVIPMDSEEVLRDHIVITAGGVITAIGPAGRIAMPRGAQVINGRGGYLLPGLIDSHVHLRDPSELRSYLAYGVTTVVHLSGSSSGGLDVLALRDRVTRGEILGPAIYTSGRILDGDPPIYPTVSVIVRTEEEARRAVAAQIDGGADFIKVYNNLGARPLRAAIEAAHQRGVLVVGHIPRIDGRATALDRALDAGLDVIAHGEEYFFTSFYEGIETQLDDGSIPVIDESRIPEAVASTKAAGASVIPNLSFVAMTRMQLDDMQRVLSDAEFRFLTSDVQEMWRQRDPARRNDRDRFDRRERSKYGFVQRLTLALSEAGVPLLAGTDASAPGMFPGSSLHLELHELVRAGLSPRQALEAATRAPGSLIAPNRAAARSFGTISVGSRADMVLFHRNPAEDISNVDTIDGVLVRGTWLAREDLQRLRDDHRAEPRVR